MVGCWEFQINMWFWEGSGRLDELKVKGLWMVIDHQALAPSRLSLPLLPRLWSSTNVFPRNVGRLPAFFLTSVPWALMLPRCIRHPTVIAHWHLGTWKCFSWVWVTPYTQEGPPASLPPSLFFLWTRPWHVVCGPVLGGLIRLASVTTLWKQHRTFYTGRRTRRLGAETEHLLLGLTRCLVKWNMRETLHCSPVTVSI